jgi:hypothetical protein
MILPPPITPSYRKDLYTMVSAWDNDPADALEPSRYKQMLDEVLFHGELRFAQYVPFRDDEGPFLRRLWSFLMNVPDERRRKSLLSLFQRLMFIDSRQMAALYKDAYRRVVIPWLTNVNTPMTELLSPRYQLHLREGLASCTIASITESFSLPDFMRVNGLAGVQKASVLTENEAVATALINAEARFQATERCIIFEDFVGTGKQARNVLLAVRNLLPQTRILFAPLIVLERGQSTLREIASDTLEVSPIIIVRASSCIQRTAMALDGSFHAEVRQLILDTADKVLTKYGDHDDPPTNPFGYRSSGALLITVQNTPNNNFAPYSP